MLNKFSPYLVLLIVGLGVSGCGSSDKLNRQSVSGTVNYKGKPLPAGQITFNPQGGQPTQLSLEIKDGTFSTTKDKGLAPGKYTIKIQGYEGPMPTPTNDAPGSAPPAGTPKAINPGKYGEKSQETVEIKEGDKNNIGTLSID